jgi:hypothetical protein
MELMEAVRTKSIPNHAEQTATRLKYYDPILLIAALLLVLMYVGRAERGFPLDDSWIHQTYARNLAQTGEWAFVPGELSAASTAPLYTVLLSIGYALNLSPLLWTHALGWLALALTGMVGARLAERLAPEQRFAPFVTGLTLVFAWHLTWAAASGMETMLFSLWTLMLIWCAWSEIGVGYWRVGRGAIFGALAALTTLTRPEGIMLAGLIGLCLLIARPQGTLRQIVIWGISAAVGFALAIAPYLAYNIVQTGGILPDTAAAKVAENTPLLNVSFPARIINLLFPMVAGVQVLLVPVAVYYAARLIRQIKTDRSAWLYLLTVIWPVALVLLYAARLPAPYQHGRYVIPMLPAFIVSGMVGTFWLLRDWRHAAVGRVLAQVVLLTALLTVAYFGLAIGPQAYAKDVQIIHEEMVATAHWVAENIPPDELLAVHDIGAVGYFAPRPILDLAGLVSPEVVPIILDKERLWQLLFERDAVYIMALPDQVPGWDTSDRRLCPIFTTNGTASPAAGGANMTIYEIRWDEICPNR